MLNPLNFIRKIFKSSNQIEIDKIQYLLKKINDFEDEISKLEDKDFPKRTLNLKSKSEFLKRYGHLRPDTYEISSKSYRQNYKNYFGKRRKIFKLKKKKFVFSSIQKNKIKKFLNDSNLNISFDNFVAP